MLQPNELAKFRLGLNESLETGFGKKLVVDQAGRCEFWLESNSIQPDVPEIGYYAFGIDATEAASLRDLFKAFTEQNLPPSGPMPSGTPMASVFLDENGQVSTKSFYPYIPSDSWQAIKRRLTNVEKAALQAVKAGLRAGLTIATESADRSEAISVTVRLAGVGSRAVSFYNPMSPADEGSGSLLLMAVRSDIPERELSVLHHKFYELSLEDLKSRLPDEPDYERPLLQFEPDTELVLKFKSVLDWPPGEYSIRLKLVSNGPQPENEKAIFVRGQIVTPAVRLLITGESKPDDEGATHYEPPVL